MAEEVVIRITGDDQASADLIQVREALRGNEAALGDVSDASRESAQTSGDAADGLKSVNESALLGADGLARFGLAVQGAREMLGILQNTIGSAIEARKEQLQVEAQLRFAIQRATDSVEEQNRALAEAEAAGVRWQRQTTFASEQVQGAYATIARMTGEVTDANELLTLSVNAAIFANEDLERTAERIARVRDGEVAAIRRMHILNQEQINQLNQIEDASERGAAAIQAIAEATKGAADSQDEFLVQSARLQNDFDDATAKVGEFVIELGNLATGLIFAQNAAEPEASGLERFTNWLDGAVRDTRQLSKEFEAWRVGFRAYMSEGNVFFNTIDAINRGHAELAQQEVWSKQSDDLREYQRLVEEFQAGLDVPDAPDDEFTRPDLRPQPTRDPAEERAAEAARREAQRRAELRRITQQQIRLAEMDLEISQATTEEERIRLSVNRQIEAVQQRIADEELRSLQIAIIRAEEAKALGRIEEEARLRQEEEAQRQAELIRLDEWRNEIALGHIEILQEEDEFRRAHLEYQLAITELSQMELTTQEERLELLRIEQGYREAIERIRKREEDEAARARRAEADDLRNLAGVFRGTGSQMAADVGNVVAVLAQIKEGSASSVAALGAVGQAAASFAGQIGASAEQQAAILAIFETAMGFATLWTNPAESAAHFLAAANFGMIAAGVGSDSGRGGGGTTSLGEGQLRESAQEAARAGGQALAENLGRAGSDGGGDVININFSGVHLESAPRMQEHIRRGVDAADRRRVERRARG